MSAMPWVKVIAHSMRWPAQMCQPRYWSASSASRFWKQSRHPSRLPSSVARPAPARFSVRDAAPARPGTPPAERAAPAPADTAQRGAAVLLLAFLGLLRALEAGDRLRRLAARLDLGRVLVAPDLDLALGDVVEDLGASCATSEIRSATVA